MPERSDQLVAFMTCFTIIAGYLLLSVAGRSALVFSSWFDKVLVHTSCLRGQDWITELLTGHDGQFHNELGLNKHVFRQLLLRNDSTRDPEPLEEGQLEEEPFGDNQVWAAVLAQKEQRHTEVMRQRAKYHGMSPSTNSCDKEEVEQMLQDTQARMERLSLELDERHLPGRHVTSLKAARRPWTMPYRSALGHDR
ncbi:hypothetical protein BJY52DRAFT_1228299 [Lactarius psammicola]|nr:hypothetical protein BJY52DRAFT_1228299 [Lactarius psammicola]